MKLGTMKILTTGTGWMELRFAAEPGESVPRVFAKLELRDGHDVITRLVIDDQNGIHSGTLRALPIARLEAYMSQFGPRQPVEGARALTPEELARFESEGVLFNSRFDAIDENLGAVMAATAGGDEPSAAAAREPLSRPDGSDPDTFSRRVAEAYASIVATTSRPAPVLAAEAGVPVATVHRWILEARRRGYIPPARKGRAG